MKKISFILLIIVNLMMITSCSNSKENVIKSYGTIKYIAAEGGFYGIIADNGEKYDPINLDKNYQQDGLRVYFEAKLRPDLTSFHMWGIIIEIIKINKINP
ncbi:MAG: hypothetical protein OEV44_11320 [Spirochaetota bacterium]|nr:hypothetical protein [Spirochaetota bacterium]